MRSLVQAAGNDLDADFAPRPIRELITERLIHGEGRRSIADDLGASLESVNREVAQAVREWTGEAGTYRERLALLHMQLDDIVDRLYTELGAGRGYDLTQLAAVLVEVHRLRAGLLNVERRPSRATTQNTTEPARKATQP
jgi:hypothetical protein